MTFYLLKNVGIRIKAKSRKCPLDPDPDQERQTLANPDTKHFLKVA
jgi:hypothetical protein